MKKFSLIAFATTIALAQPAFAQDTSGLFADNVTPIQIGAKSYPRVYLQDAFLSAAISKSYKGNNPIVPMLPIERYTAPNTAATDFFDKTILERRYPWLYSLIYPSFVPANDLIFHKWIKPVTISLGYPNDFKPYEDLEAWKAGKTAGIASHQGGYRKPEVNGWVEEQIKKEIPNLAITSKLDIKFIPHNEENIANIANVRVVLVHPSTFGESKYKSKGLGSFGEDQYPLGMVENFLPYVAFTPDVENQLSGYFVQNKKGEIQFAVCKIMEDHPKEMIQNLVRECLVRSLGFPSITTATPSILSNWNNSSWKDKDVSLDTNGRISDLDLYFIKSLYDESISAGENITDIF